jgi:hypothetical protein
LQLYRKVIRCPSVLCRRIDEFEELGTMSNWSNEHTLFMFMAACGVVIAVIGGVFWAL